MSVWLHERYSENPAADFAVRVAVLAWPSPYCAYPDATHLTAGEIIARVRQVYGWWVADLGDLTVH